MFTMLAAVTAGLWLSGMGSTSWAMAAAESAAKHRSAASKAAPARYRPVSGVSVSHCTRWMRPSQRSSSAHTAVLSTASPKASGEERRSRTRRWGSGSAYRLNQTSGAFEPNSMRSRGRWGVSTSEARSGLP